MKEEEFALQLIKDAENFWDENNKETQPKPSIIFDKEAYKKYDFNLIKKILDKNGYDMFDLEQAPSPYNLFQLENKCIALKKE